MFRLDLMREKSMTDIPDETRSTIVEAVWILMDALARRDSALLADAFRCSRCEEADVLRVMDEYGGTFAAPPKDSPERFWIMPILDDPSLYAVDAEFWDAERRMTDLSAQLTVRLSQGATIIEIDDIRVM